MATFHVWHRRTPTFRENAPATLTAFPAGFSHVATVEADGLDDVFERTNSIDGPWWENPGVIASRGVRSTSVGDVIVSEEGLSPTSPGSRWSVEGFGFHKF